MSNTRYLEVTSAHRDRYKWPNPAEFEVDLTDSSQCHGGLNVFSARNPKSSAYPVHGWHGLPVTRRVNLSWGVAPLDLNQVWPPIEGDSTGGITSTMWGVFVGGTKSQPILGVLLRKQSGAGAPANTIQTDSLFQSGLNVVNNGGAPLTNILLVTGKDNYFAGALLARIRGATPGGKANIMETSRILSFDGTTGMCTLESPLDALDIESDNYVIIFDQNITLLPVPPGIASGTPFNPGGQSTDPTTPATYNPNPTLFINGGPGYNNAFARCIVEDVTLTQGGFPTSAIAAQNPGTTYDALSGDVLTVNPITSIISSYDSVTRTASLVDGFGASGGTWNPSADNITVGSETHNYVIRCESQPIIRGCVSQNGVNGGLGNAAAAPVLANSATGCVSSLGIIPDVECGQITGTGYTNTGGGGVAADVYLTTSNGLGTGLTVRYLQPGPNSFAGDSNGGFFEIANPGLPSGGYLVGDIITVTAPAGGTSARLVVQAVGFGIDLGFSNRILPAQTNLFKGELFYIPSRYPSNALAAGTPFTNYPTSVPTGYGGQDTTDYGPDWPNNPSVEVGGGADPTDVAQLIGTYVYGTSGCATRRWKSTLPAYITSTGDIPENGVRKILGYFRSGSAGSGAAASRSVVVDAQYPLTALPDHTYFEILPFEGDQWSPLEYSGSTVSQNQMVCHEIELVSLILPNETLALDPGGIISFYPYVYVELTNVSSPSSGINNVITSNNPNAIHALFKVPITDVPQKLISTFIKLDGAHEVQTVKFKPNDTLRFRVFFPNGDTFTTTTTDPVPPLPPADLVQISAIFSYRRL